MLRFELTVFDGKRWSGWEAWTPAPFESRWFAPLWFDHSKE